MTDLRGLPKPRRELFPITKSKGYNPIPIPIGIETSRGCPNDCEFCCIGQTLGQQYRVRPVQEVIAEIEAIDSPHLFFVDDALGLNRKAAKELFTEMIPLRKRWLAQGTVSLAEDVELLGIDETFGVPGAFDRIRISTERHTE